MAVSSSIAYAGTDMPAAHLSASAMVFSGNIRVIQVREDREVDDSQRFIATAWAASSGRSPPRCRGVITMLPALSPTQTVSRSEGRRSASPDCRIQWHRYKGSPPFTSRTSASWTQGTQRSRSMLGSAVSSSTPTDFQPNSTIGVRPSCPLMKRQAWPGPVIGCPYVAVGMQRALESAIGLPSSSTRASRMLGFLMPADVRRSLIVSPESYVVIGD